MCEHCESIALGAGRYLPQQYGAVQGWSPLGFRGAPLPKLVWVGLAAWGRFWGWVLETHGLVPQL